MSIVVLKDAEGKEYKFEKYNGFLVQEGTVTIINNRVEAERDQHDKKLDELDAKYKELGTQHEELRKKTLTAEELVADAEKKRVQRENELIAENESNKSKYKKFRIESELLTEIAGFKTASGDEPFNHNQVLKLLRGEYDEADLLNDKDVVFKKGTNTVTAKDAVKTFLESEASANLMKSGLKSGGDTKQPGVGGSGKIVTKEQYDEMSGKERAAFMGGGGEIEVKK